MSSNLFEGIPKGGKQRKGQFLWNELEMSLGSVFLSQKIKNTDEKIAIMLWNLKDEKFDSIMKKLEKS